MRKIYRVYNGEDYAWSFPTYEKAVAWIQAYGHKGYVYRVVLRTETEEHVAELEFKETPDKVAWVVYDGRVPMKVFDSFEPAELWSTSYLFGAGRVVRMESTPDKSWHVTDTKAKSPCGCDE